MILTVTLNAAIDVTYQVESFIPGSAMRVARVHERPGGKGVNVARVLSAIGVPACATGLVGGRRGEAIRAGLAGDGVREEFEVIAGESRQTVVVTDGRRHPTEFDEPGPLVRPAEWERFQRRFARLVPGADVAVLAGSLPPGVPGDAYATLAATARRAGVPVIVDAGGPALRLACAARPDVVTPNHRELDGAVADGGSTRGGEGVIGGGHDAAGESDAAAGESDGAGGADGAAGGDGAAGNDGARSHGQPGPGGSAARIVAALSAGEKLRHLGAGAVVASLGSDGVVAVTDDGCWQVSHRRVAGNPVGAGDALTAGLAAGYLGSRGWADLLASATGLAMASVTRPRAGEVEAATAAELSASVRIRQLRALA